MARKIQPLFALIQDLEKRAELAQVVETSGDYLYQIATGFRRASSKLATRIELETGIPCEELRPDREWVVLADGRKVDVGPDPNFGEAA